MCQAVSEAQHSVSSSLRMVHLLRGGVNGGWECVNRVFVILLLYFREGVMHRAAHGQLDLSLFGLWIAYKGVCVCCGLVLLSVVVRLFLCVCPSFLFSCVCVVIVLPFYFPVCVW